MDRGTNRRRISPTQIRVYAAGFCIAQLSAAGSCGLVLPKASRAAWVTADTGFQLAKVFSGSGSVLAGTNVLAMNVTGKMMMNAALLTISGARTSSPTQAITHEIA